MKKILSILLCCVVAISYSQEKDPDKVLNSLINKSVFGKGALIFVKQGTVITDSTSVKRIDHFRNSLVRIKFRNNRQLLLPKEAFWGLVTDYNERRRFYKNETYILWRTTAPYIYKDMKHRNDNRYYFSESLTADLYPLLAANIEPVINDKGQQDVLKKFIAEHKIGQAPSAEPAGSTSRKADNGVLISLVSEIIYIFAALTNKNKGFKTIPSINHSFRIHPFTVDKKKTGPAHVICRFMSYGFCNFIGHAK